MPFFSLSGSEFVEMFVGVGAARVRDLFDQAEAKAPCIVFIDELDALGKVARAERRWAATRSASRRSTSCWPRWTASTPARASSSWRATNRPEVLDPALMRPGRFDRQVLVDKPDVRGREAILKIHVRKVKLAEHVDLRRSSRRGRRALPAPISPTS